MVDIQKILIDGAILSALASIFIILTMRFGPRIWLHDYPKEIQAMVPPKTDQEKRLSLQLGIPFMLLLLAVPLLSTLWFRNSAGENATFVSLAAHAFGVILVFNLVDWLLLDWLMFCTITPSWVVIPGSEGAPGYKDYGFHFRGFLKGVLFSALGGAIIGLILSI